MRKAIFFSVIALLTTQKMSGQATGIGGTRSEADPALKKVAVTTKKITREMATSATPHVFIKYSYNSVEIKTWDENKIKVTTSVRYEGDRNYTDKELWDKSHIELSGNEGSVKIKTLPVAAGAIYTLGKATTITGNNPGGKYTPAATTEKTTVILIPRKATLELETEYTDVLISSAITSLDLRITSGSIDANDAGNLKLQSRYSNVNFGNTQTLSMLFEFGKFKAKNVDNLEVDSKSAAIELENVKKAVIRSDNDEYEMQDVATIQLTKQYGSLRIEQLTGKLVFEGTNGDIRLRKIAPSVSTVEISNKFASMNLPSANLKNYTVDFKGQYATIYAPFNKIPVNDTAAGLPDAPVHFKAVVGESKASHTSFLIKCDKCIVDFK